MWIYLWELQLSFDDHRVIICDKLEYLNNIKKLLGLILIEIDWKIVRNALVKELNQERSIEIT